MLVSILVNTSLVLLGYYLGLKKAQSQWRAYLNDSDAIREAFTLHLKGAPEAVEDAEDVATDPVLKDPLKSDPALVYDPALKDPEATGGRIFKYFN